jgi:alanine racemase
MTELPKRSHIETFEHSNIHSSFVIRISSFMPVSSFVIPTPFVGRHPPLIYHVPMPSSAAEPRLLISRSALLHNVTVLRAAAPGAKVCAMIKANAYGHDAHLVADALVNFSGERGQEAPAVDAVGVATIDEAAALPQLPVPLLIFQPVENAFVTSQRPRIEHAIQSDWHLMLCSKSAADDVARIAGMLKKQANVQVMIDTGMARSGVEVDRARELLNQVNQWPALRLTGVCTHLAAADMPGDFIGEEQLAHFRRLTDPLKGKTPLHAANSAATFFLPQSHFNMIRPGISLYGIDPTGKPSVDRKLRPVAKWTAPLVGVRHIPKGQGVGYSHTWSAPRESRIGLIPIGYADGYARILSNRSSMIVQGKRAPVVGRVSMDMVTIDLTDIPQANLGDEVTLIDSDPLSPASAYELARLADTIPYEILCRIGPRVRRVGVDPDDTADDPPIQPPYPRRK